MHSCRAAMVNVGLDHRQGSNLDDLRRKHMKRTAKRGLGFRRRTSDLMIYLLCLQVDKLINIKCVFTVLRIFLAIHHLFKQLLPYE